MARLRAAAEPAPQTLIQAEALAVDLAALMREIERRETLLDDAIARLKLDFKTMIDPMSKAVDAKFKALATFAAGHRSEILPENRKSREIAAGTIGWRLSNASVAIEPGMEEAVIDWLEANNPALLQEVVSISKSAMLADREATALVPFVSVVQPEHFFFKPAGGESEKSKLVGRVPAEQPAQPQPARVA
jgi:phage host-nuclease inhibitor protein Gam